MWQLHANWFAKTNAKTHVQFMQGQHLGFTRCKEELQSTKEHKMAMQKHRQPLQQTIPTRTLYKTQGYAHQKMQAHPKHTTLPYTISIGFCKEICAKHQIIENTGLSVTRASLYGTFWF